MLPSYTTAPRLLHSLYTHNLRRKKSDFSSPRTDVDCQHLYATKHAQSKLHDPSHRKAGDHEWRVAATCQLCLARLDVKITQNTESVPCPTNEHPLHIFSEGSESDESDGVLQFACIAPACRSSVSITFKSPVLEKSDLQLLALQVSQAEEREAEHKQRIESKRLTLFRNLRTFRTYIIDALETDEPKRILTTNPRFVEVFGTGQASDNLLKRFGFRLDYSSAYAAWYLPRPQKLEEKNELQDLAEELTILLRKRPKPEQVPGSELSFEPPPRACFHDLESILGSSSYPRSSATQSTSDSSEQHEQDLPYIRLGIMPDFSDSLVLWAYKRLISILDHENHPYLFQALKDIAVMRNSEQLNLEVGTLESQGMKAAGDIEYAYSVLGIDPNHANVINDMSILGAYRSRFIDVSMEEQNRMRAALQIIAEYKHSNRLLQEARGTIETYQQALDWLGAPDRQTDDEFIFSLMAIKIEESPHNEELARKAVEIIAAERESDRLRALLAGNEPPKQELTLSDAYEMLGCQDTNAIEDSLLIDSYRIGILDNPSRKVDLKQALTIIADSRKSLMLTTFLQSEEVPIENFHRNNLHDPRGLKNIGNTCYLNSLLQYLFTIKPLREIVSNFQDYRQQVSADLTTVKRVSNVEVKARAILRAQNFVQELHRLFSQLITATEPFVTPEYNLARLTLVNVVDETVRRRSTISSSRHPTTASGDVQEHFERQGLKENSVNELVPCADAPFEQLKSPRAAYMDKETKRATLPATSEENSSDKLIQEDENTTNEDGMLVDSSTSLSVSDSTQRIQRAEYEEFARQQDVREVIQNVLGQLRWSIQSEGEESGGEQIDPISRLFYGKENYVTVNEIKEESKTQPFFDIWIYLVSGSCDIYTALDRTFDRDIIEGLEDQSTRTFQYRTITCIPAILQISVSRVNFDMQTAQTYKIEDQLRLQEVICMDRYVADPIMLEKRRQSWGLKGELRRLKSRREKLTKTELQLDLADLIKQTSDYLAYLTQNANEFGLEDLRLDNDVFNTLDTVVKDIKNEIAKIDTEILAIETRLSNLFENAGQFMYRLHAVFVHRGNSRAGHWFIYLYDSESKVWRNYNDETVVLVSDTRTIFEPLAPRDGTSSFVVYIRDSRWDEIIETIHRDPKKPEPVKPFIPYEGFKPPYT